MGLIKRYTLESLQMEEHEIRFHARGINLEKGNNEGAQDKENSV